jgi:ornithine cyclodeaminase/alanine dehydrogenase-like protein (mu-crystallin family)
MNLVSQALVRQHLDIERASSLIERGFRDLRDKIIASGDRTVFDPKKTNPVIGFMPACDNEFLSAKVACVSYENPSRGRDSHQGVILLFERASGALRSIMDATELTAIRTTAVTHFALGKLMPQRPKIRKVAIIGAGVQAYHHIRMLSSSYQIGDYVLVSRSNQRFQKIKEQFKAGISMEHREYGDLLKDCDVIILATHGDEVILTLSQVKQAVVIFGLGSCKPAAQEIANDILDRCVFIADNFEACVKSSGEGRHIAKNGTSHHLEISDLIQDLPEKELKPLTVVKTVGLGFEDLVCARFLHEKLSNSPESMNISNFGGALAY